MNPTQVLMKEHRVIERVLDALEKATQALEQGKPVRTAFFLEVADFIRGFADGCHHQKEEDVLFIAMSKAGVPVQGGPIGVMLQEHEQGRQYTRLMRQSAEKIIAGDAAARQDLTASARGYVALLRQHIAKEDQVLFPLADRLIPAPQQQQLQQDFDRLEHTQTGEGLHEKYISLAAALQAEAEAAAM